MHERRTPLPDGTFPLATDLAELISSPARVSKAAEKVFPVDTF